ncbi:MAG: hypothetical protein QG622_3361 [Actinomycetota bacterium]|nr:hypothetical protein [Actinomycetota bacterium]
MLTGLLDGPVLWYANRATGVVLVVLFTLAVVLGMLSTARTTSVRWPRFATQSLHRNVSLLAGLMLFLHITSAVVDTYVDIRWYEGLVPFAGSYETIWLGIGTVSCDLTLAIVLTSLVRQRMNLRHWRFIHLLSYPAWAVGVVHGVGIGTDSFTTWGLAVSGGCTALVVAVGIARMVTLVHERRLAI